MKRNFERKYEKWQGCRQECLHPEWEIHYKIKAKDGQHQQQCQWEVDHHQECKVVVVDHLVAHLVAVLVDLVVEAVEVVVSAEAAVAFVVVEVVVALVDRVDSEAHQIDLEVVSVDEVEEEDDLHQLT